MIKIYLDWNVMSQMKNGYHKELLEIITDSKVFLLPYSTSHIGDLFAGYSENKTLQGYINDDLSFIESLTNNWCLYNASTEILMDTLEPQTLFQQRIDEKDLLTDFSSKEIESLLINSSSTQNETLSELNLQLENVIQDALDKNEDKTLLHKLIPNIRKNMSLGDLIKSTMNMFVNLLETEDYSILRKEAQNQLGINRDKIYNSKEPYKQIENVKSNLHGLHELESIKDIAPEWYNKLSNEYVQLDMMGYQEDKVQVKKNKRKETMRNTIEDSHHAAFASTCNFYILNDNKSYKKTKQVYAKLNQTTMVLKPEEFVTHFQKYIQIPKDIKHLNLVSGIIETCEYFEDKIKNGTQRTYFLPQFIYFFFNKLIIIIPDNSKEEFTIMLSRYRPVNDKNTYIFEIDNLVNLITEELGAYINKNNKVSKDEFINGSWDGRTWQIENLKVILRMINGYVQLYFE